MALQIDGLRMQLTDNAAQLEAIAARLATRPRVFLDTEFESSRHGSTLCLVQISDGERIALIDALRLRDLDVLGRAIGRRDCEWVLHAGGQDVPLLLRHLRLDEPPPLFDTQVAWALVSPEYSVSLAYLLFRLLGLRSPKTHQADDWKRRPLPQSQLEYAAGDVAHLPELHAALVARAEQLGRAAVIPRATRELVWPRPEPTSLPTIESFRNAWQLDRAGQAALRALVEWYNGLDERARSEAPEPKVLFSIASRLPETPDALGRIKGIPRGWCARRGEALTLRLDRATAEAAAGEFVPIDPPPYNTFEEIELDAWLSMVRAATCTLASIAPELAFPTRLLRRVKPDVLARGSSDALVDALTDWRAEVLSRPLTEACRRYPWPLPS